jgi:hypothetical protein
MYVYLGGGPLVVEVSTKYPAFLEVSGGTLSEQKVFPDKKCLYESWGSNTDLQPIMCPYLPLSHKD